MIKVNGNYIVQELRHMRNGTTEYHHLATHNNIADAVIEFRRLVVGGAPAAPAVSANRPDEWTCAVKPADVTEIYLSKPDRNEGAQGLAISIFEAESDTYVHNFHTLDQARQMRAQLDAIIAQIEQRLPDHVEFDEATGRVQIVVGPK